MRADKDVVSHHQPLTALPFSGRASLKPFSGRLSLVASDWALVRIRRVLCLVSKFVNAKMYSRGSVERSGTKERERSGVEYGTDRWISVCGEKDAFQEIERRRREEKYLGLVSIITPFEGIFYCQPRGHHTVTDSDGIKFNT